MEKKDHIELSAKLIFESLSAIPGKFVTGEYRPMETLQWYYLFAYSLVC